MIAAIPLHAKRINTDLHLASLAGNTARVDKELGHGHVPAPRGP